MCIHYTTYLRVLIALVILANTFYLTHYHNHNPLPSLPKSILQNKTHTSRTQYQTKQTVTAFSGQGSLLDSAAATEALATSAGNNISFKYFTAQHHTSRYLHRSQMHHPLILSSDSFFPFPTSFSLSSLSRFFCLLFSLLAKLKV